MREILFRGKRCDNREWIIGYLLKLEDGRARITESHTDIFCYEKDSSIIQTIAHEVDPNTIGQYTGLSDYNGKKIFDGDIVKMFMRDGEDVGFIRWSNIDARFKFAASDGCAYGIDRTTDMEVIGNIQDSPNWWED